MKKILLITLMVVGLSSFSQNWNLIHSGYTCNYALEGTYDVSVYVKSVNANGADSVFLMNKIVLPCDTCSGEMYGALLSNQATFLQHQITKSNNIYRFYGQDSFAILPNAELNETWIFDTLNNITAELVLKIEEPIFLGINDSTKYIKLSNNDTIIISKKHGIVRFDTSEKSYCLIGVETPIENLGYFVPKFKDFYDFEVGDVFQYRKLKCSGSVDDHIDFIKQTVLEKTISGDTIRYVVEKKVVNAITINCEPVLYENESNYYSSSVDTLVFIDSLNHFTNSYNHELYSNHVDYYGEDTIYYESVLVFEDEGKTNKSYNLNPFSNSNSLYFKHPQMLDVLIPSFEFIALTQRVGLGLIYKEQMWFESSVWYELIGYIKKGTTMGVVYENEFYLSVEEFKQKKQDISVYPNPAQDQLFIKGNLHNIENISIYDITGKLVLNVGLKAVAKNDAFDVPVSNLEKGLYFIKVNGQTNKFVKL